MFHTVTGSSQTVFAGFCSDSKVVEPYSYGMLPAASGRWPNSYGNPQVSEEPLGISPVLGRHMVVLAR